LCPDFLINILGLAEKDIPDPGWVWVDSHSKFRWVSGTVASSEVTHSDFPASHDSHDEDIYLRVDPGQENRLSDTNYPNEDDQSVSKEELLQPTIIELEWEAGTPTYQTFSYRAEKTFPHWVWPSVGDRVWAEGNWVFDCGHGTTVDGVLHRRTEIHPPRAIATMRDQVVNWPDVGPMLITATELYVHGQAGAVTDILNCGPEALIGQGSCGFTEPHRGTPIDENFEFDIPLPPKRTAGSELRTMVQAGSGNTINVKPILDPLEDHIHVTIPLAGTGVDPGDAYAWRIYAGWTDPRPIRLFQVTLTKMVLHNEQDHEIKASCECSFFWINLNRATREWEPLVNFDVPTDDNASFPCPENENHLRDWDDDHGCGNGHLDFKGPSWTFYVVDRAQTFTVRINGYDQDCLDQYFGHHRFLRETFIACYAMSDDDNDAYPLLTRVFYPPEYGVGEDIRVSNSYMDAFLTVRELNSASGSAFLPLLRSRRQVSPT
jgi:hypothetical protein